MAKEKRTIKDSFPGLEYLDRDKVRETFVVLGKKKLKKPASGSQHHVRRLPNGRFMAVMSPLGPALADATPLGRTPLESTAAKKKGSTRRGAEQSKAGVHP